LFLLSVHAEDELIRGFTISSLTLSGCQPPLSCDSNAIGTSRAFFNKNIHI
jgi:hypothetical protein